MLELLQGALGFPRFWTLVDLPYVPRPAGVGVDADMLNPAIADCGLFSEIVPLIASHSAPLAASLLPAFLAAANDADVSMAAALPSAVAGEPASIVSVAQAEWDFFSKQSYDLAGNLDHAGHTEAEEGYYERIGIYWLEGTGTHGVDDRNTSMPWSAAFISWMMIESRLRGRFHAATMHSVYISQAIRDFQSKRQAAVYWGWRLNDRKPLPGDLVCWGRQGRGIDYDHQAGGSYSGHSDVVTEVSDRFVSVIGGNVGDSVSLRMLPLNASGYLEPIISSGENLFALMGNRVSEATDA